MTEPLEDLAARAVAGDAGALSRLCTELATPVFRIALRLLGDVRDAEDAAQDVLVLVITHLSSFEGRSALLTWVYRITVRHVLSLRPGRAEVRALDEDALGALLEHGLAYGAGAPPPGPDDAALASEIRLSCTQGMLTMLAREERLALVLVDLLGFDGAEAAALCEMGHDAFRKRLSRARERLVTFMQARCGLVNDDAACRCARQVPARVAHAGRSLRFTPLSDGDLVPPAALTRARDELAGLRRVVAAFHQGAAFRAPETLRARLHALLPTVLA